LLGKLPPLPERAVYKLLVRQLQLRKEVKFLEWEHRIQEKKDGLFAQARDIVRRQ
jgi:hypothetical protein